MAGSRLMQQTMGVTNFIGIQNQSHASCETDKLCCATVSDSRHARMPSSADSTNGDSGRNTGCDVPDASDSGATRHYPLQLNTFRSCLIKINGIPCDKQGYRTRETGRCNIAGLAPHLPFVVPPLPATLPNCSDAEKTACLSVNNGHDVDFVFFWPMKVNNSSCSATSTAVPVPGNSSGNSSAYCLNQFATVPWLTPA